MYLSGDCRSMYWLTSRLTVDQYIGRSVGQYLVDSRLICWRHSVAIVYQSIVRRYFAARSLTYHRHVADVMAGHHPDTSPILDWQFINICTLPTHYQCHLDRLSVDLPTDMRPTGKHHLTEISVDTWPILDWLSTDILVEIRPSISRHIGRYVDQHSIPQKTHDPKNLCFTVQCYMQHNIKIIEHPVGLSFFNFFWLADTTKLYYTFRVWFLWFVGSKSFWSWVGMNIDLDLNEVSVAFCAGCSFFPTFSFTFWKSCSLSFLFLLFFAMSENRALSTDKDKFYQTQAIVKDRGNYWLTC